MLNSGTLSCFDTPDFCLFLGPAPGTDGTGFFVDSTDFSNFYGIIISDSTRLYPDMTFTQGEFLGAGSAPTWIFPDDPAPPPDATTLLPNFDPTSAWVDPTDPPMYFFAHDYAGGHLDGTTWSDGTWRSYFYDPIWVNWSLWYTQDASNNLLIGTRFREPARQDVGRYYNLFEVPSPTGHYEMRWRYQKDSSAYARERVQGFWCRSAGIEPDRT